jgi:hypothetical protein
MVFNNLPPQAYTRDTLALAYEWLSEQSVEVKEMANNADTLVALYLQARRRQQSANNGGGKDNNTLTNARPAGTANHTQVENAIKSQTTYESEGFKSDLKALAENMKQFDERDPFLPMNKSNEQQTISNAFQTSSIQKIPDQYIIEEVIRKTTPTNPRLNISTSTPIPRAPTEPRMPVDVLNYLDVRTREILQETCRRLNLSSEHEALRMLVVIGSDRIQGWLPQK